MAKNVYKSILYIQESFKKCFHKFSFQLWISPPKNHVSSQNISLKYIMLLNADDNNFQNKPNPTKLKALHLNYIVATY